MSDDATLEDVIVYLVHGAQRPLGITQVMKLVFLADIEHARLYGTSLTQLDWNWYEYGAFNRAVYRAVASLGESGKVLDTMTFGQRTVAPLLDPVDAYSVHLAPPCVRALERTLEKYGNLTLMQLKATAYETETMKKSEPGKRLNVLNEPRTGASETLSRVAELRVRAPKPNRDEWGDPDASAAEDIAILHEFSDLREKANQELH